MMWQPRADHEQKHELGDVTITQGLDTTRPITGLRERANRPLAGCGGSPALPPHAGHAEPPDHRCRVRAVWRRPAEYRHRGELDPGAFGPCEAWQLVDDRAAALRFDARR